MSHSFPFVHCEAKVATYQQVLNMMHYSNRLLMLHIRSLDFHPMYLGLCILQSTSRDLLQTLFPSASFIFYLCIFDILKSPHLSEIMQYFSFLHLPSFTYHNFSHVYSSMCVNDRIPSFLGLNCVLLDIQYIPQFPSHSSIGGCLGYFHMSIFNMSMNKNICIVQFH
jgi:hypothetical protein